VGRVDPDDNRPEEGAVTTFRIKARRVGDARVLSFTLPVAMSRVVPDGSHYFDTEFVEAGILLTYVGPAQDGDGRGVRAQVEPPKWAQS
jgi:hypothetical protein